MNPNKTLYTAAQVRELDRRALSALSVDAAGLMRRAGEAAWDRLRRQWPKARRIVVCCGSGNNGGDGFVLAEQAARSQRQVQIITLSGRRSKESRLAFAALMRLAPTIHPWPDARAQGLLDSPACDTVIVDALFGTGLSRALAAPALELVRCINDSGLPVLALDVPSGLDADCGLPREECVRATATISFVGRKRGLHTGQGPQYSGARHFADLGVPEEVYQGLSGEVPVALIEASDYALPARPATAHKGDFGHVLVVGGGLGRPGAALLAARASLRTGAGLVSVATRPEHAAGLVAACPELMVHGVRTDKDLQPLLESATVLVVGPGLGQSDWAEWLLAAVRRSDAPLLMDADALNLLARDSRPIRREQQVLTPHPGEAARLLSCSSAEVQANRFSVVQELQRRYGGVVVLKGSGTLIGSLENGESVSQKAEPVRLALSNSGNPGMATAGMGDVLSGVIAALMAQGLPLAIAAEYGVCLHGAAADQQAALGGTRGLLASDVIAALRSLVNPL